jgi:hypothetical protein
MRRFRFWPQMALVLALAVMNGGCVLVPEMKDRIVELAVGGSTIVAFTTHGETNTIDNSGTVNITDDLDIQSILDDAGIDVSDVVSIVFSGVDYRVTSPDPQADRTITNGNVTISRAGNGPFPLVSGFSAGAGTGNAVTNWTAGPLDPNGAAVGEINAALSAILTSLQPGGTYPPPAAQTTFTYRVVGDSDPPLVPTNFTYELKVRITITGKVKVKIPT